MNNYEDLLWRLKLIQLESDNNHQQEQTNNYVLLFTTNHCFLEARGLIRKLFELFEIFELTYLSPNGQEVKTGDVFKMTPSLETFMDKFKFEIIFERDFQTYLTESSLDEVVDKLPEIDSIRSNDLENKDYSILDHEGAVYLTFNDLFKLAKQTTTTYKSLFIGEYI